MKIREIIERKDVSENIERFGILKQYKKCKQLIVSGFLKSVDLKIQKPRQDRVYQFRITKKYRAFCVLEGKTLRVMKIDKHQ